ncbi:YSIRK-type signal peptide-containing protein [Lactobacillus crispatus]|uniref:YSIRK-type signal peptide-containing protein n=1 Tax=Lactobacillus crispatus TaxID=47770 RepID=UPI001E444049|nr:YSIRK-type signal peptide-containing protein [Lactobacillus crispatus]
MLERIPKYTLRKLSVGLASVMIGSGILMSSPKVLADTNADTANAGKSTNTDVQPGTSNQNEDKGNSENQSRTSVPDDTHSTGTDVQPGTSNQNEGKGNGESQSDASASTDATTPTTPSDSTSMAIVNDKNKLDKKWIQLDNGKGQIYFTVKGNDQKHTLLLIWIRTLNQHFTQSDLIQIV